MIHFDLACDKGHEFDGWFASNSAFEDQKGTGLLTCPACGSQKVGKRLMKPSIASRDNNQTGPSLSTQACEAGNSYQSAVRKLRKHIAENAEYVGSRFTREARRIHYQESEPRGIYGEATPEDAKALVEEGIDVHPLPLLPEENN